MIIEREKLKQSLLMALADKEMLQILDCMIEQPTSVHDVIRKTDIAHTTTYRKIKWLLDAGLIIVEKIVISPEGKKFSLFSSTVKSINATHQNGKTFVISIQRLCNKLYSNKTIPSFKGASLVFFF